MKINYPAVIVTALVHFIIGGLWYGLIFGNKFLEIMPGRRRRWNKSRRKATGANTFLRF